jgi:hypothetical protein
MYHFHLYQLYTKILCPIHLCDDYGSRGLYDTQHQRFLKAMTGLPEEFLRELAAAKVRHTQKLAMELERARGMADSAMMR